MSKHKISEPTAMVYVGHSSTTIDAAAAAIERVLKAATQEGAQTAAVHALAEMAKAPSHTTVSHCHFEVNPAKAK